jgi:hypothetical protein
VLRYFSICPWFGSSPAIGRGGAAGGHAHRRLCLVR